MQYKTVIKEWLYHLMMTFLIIAPALYNRYPLVYFDSGAYMEMSVNLMPSFHRAIGYPMLMKLTGWTISNWPIIFLQGFLVSWLLFQLVKVFINERTRWFHFLLVLLLSFATSLSWYASQLMPDIFTLILALVTLLIVFDSNALLKKLFFYGAIAFISLLTHLSHLPLLVMVIVAIYGWQWMSKSQQRMPKKAYLVFGAVTLSAFLFTCAYNAAKGFGFRMSLASNVFITANIGEMGFLKMYLDENCDQKHISLCAIKDSLPQETGGYLWENSGPIQTHPEGWEGANREYAQVVHDFLTSPKYLKWLVFGALKSTFEQMFQIELGSGLQYTYGDGSPPSWPMHSHFKLELNEYLTSVQNKDASLLPLGFFKKVNYLSLFLSALIIGWAVFNKKLDERGLLLLAVIFGFYFFNAAITGVLANVYERLQCRLLPLVQMVGLLILFSNWGDIFSRNVKSI
ncbi:MAG: hypothetical protein R2813_13525 [Flavobacteriales bacterium]